MNLVHKSQFLLLPHPAQHFLTNQTLLVELLTLTRIPKRENSYISAIILT